MDINPAPATLRLLSANIQAGTTTSRYRHYLTRGWRQVLPHGDRSRNLDAIAELVSGYDLVALQEVDTGSLRSGFINQTQYLAHQSGFPYWTHQSNRKIGSVAYSGNGVLTRAKPQELLNLRLPGAISGRGALWVRYGSGSNSLVVVALHLALSRRARNAQLAYLQERLVDEPHKMILGDFNTGTGNLGVMAFMDSLGLTAPTAGLRTYPSWQPQRAIDHVLVSEGIDISAIEALDVSWSDHCPVSVTVRLPLELEGLFALPAHVASA